MCVSEIPNLLYYSYLPAITLSLFFGVFIYLQDGQAILNRLLLAISFIFSIWITIDFITWFPWTDKSYLLFQRIMMITLVLLPLFVEFSYSIVQLKISRIKRVLIWMPILPILILSFSKYYYLIFSIEKDGLNCLIKENGLYPFVYIVGIIYLMWTITNLIKNYFFNKNEEDIVKKRVKIVIFSITIFIVWVMIFMRLGYTLSENALLFIPFGMVIFIGMLTYAITKYKMFNIKLLATQALVIALVALVGSELFFANSLTNQILILITLLISISFGYMLIKSVKLEVQRKEELQNMSDKLSEANDQLRKLDNSKSEFISIASHQLRTPLTAIKGFISLLLEGSYGKMEPKQEDVLNKVYTSNERLVTLVEDLLNISRMESGRMEFKFAPWDMSAICQEVVDTFIPKAKDLKLMLEYKKPEEHLPELMIDGVKVREVISNMVDNALKYTPKGGVKIKIEQGEKSLYTPDKVGEKEDAGIAGPVVRMIVSDTGIGVPKTELPYLFAKFSRGKDISRLNTGGTGLGLYVGRSMIENNGGRIWAESDGEGKGSRFIIEIPV